MNFMKGLVTLESKRMRGIESSVRKQTLKNFILVFCTVLFSEQYTNTTTTKNTEYTKTSFSVCELVHKQYTNTTLKIIMKRSLR